MLDNDTPVLSTFSGKDFEITIRACLLPPRHRAYVRFNGSAETAETSNDGIECSPSQLRELVNLLATANTLIAFLDEGGRVENWDRRILGSSRECS